MSRIKISPERYQSFLDAFLHLGPNHHAVARRVGCALGTARRAWDRGWPEVPYGAPISRVYAEALKRLEASKPPTETSTSSQALTQRPRESELGADSDRADAAPQCSTPPNLTPAQVLQESAIGAMQGEIDLLTCFRGNLIGAVSVSAKVLKALEALGDAVAENTIIAAQNVAQATPERMLKPLERFARIMTLLTTSADQVMKMQRLLVGAPQQITENRAPDGADLSERMQRAGKLIEMMRRNGLINTDEVPPPYEGEEKPDAKGHTDAA